MFLGFLRMVSQNIKGKKYNLLQYNCQTLALNVLADLGIRDQVSFKPYEFPAFNNDLYVVEEDQIEKRG